jgi:peroxiredoxin
MGADHVKEKIIIEKDELERLYINNQYSTVDIGKIYGVSHKIINKLLRKYNIQIRNFSESQKTINNRNKIKMTNLKKYGVEHACQRSEVKEKKKKTNLKKYGVENIFEKIDYIKSKFKEKYGVDNPMNLVDVKQKLQNTNIQRYGVKNIFEKTDYIRSKFKEKYGVDNPMKDEKIKFKYFQSIFEKYGVNSISNSNLIKEKKIQTCLKNHGVKYPMQSSEIRQKTINTLLKRYGVDHVSKIKDIKERIKNTNLKKYGVEYPSQNPDIFHKIISSSFRKKIYVFPSGRIELVQGYEPRVLDILLYLEKIDESDIKVGVKNVPVIEWIDDNNKKRKHYPDIWIPNQNRLIEVKSKWYSNEKRLDMWLKRKKAAEQLGYFYDLIILE